VLKLESSTWTRARREGGAIGGNSVLVSLAALFVLQRRGLLGGLDARIASSFPSDARSQSTSNRVVDQSAVMHRGLARLQEVIPSVSIYNPKENYECSEWDHSCGQAHVPFLHPPRQRGPEEVDGVSSVQVKLREGQVLVRHEPNSSIVPVLVDALREAGYESSPLVACPPGTLPGEPSVADASAPPQQGLSLLGGEPHHAYMIVGGGPVALRAAEAVRKAGFEGEVVLVGAERELPYDRPPLSKEYLAGVGEREALFIHPSSFYSEGRRTARARLGTGGVRTRARNGYSNAVNRCVKRFAARPRTDGRFREPNTRSIGESCAGSDCARAPPSRPSHAATWRFRSAASGGCAWIVVRRPRLRAFLGVLHGVLKDETLLHRRWHPFAVAQIHVPRRQLDPRRRFPGRSWLHDRVRADGCFRLLVRDLTRRGRSGPGCDIRRDRTRRSPRACLLFARRLLTREQSQRSDRQRGDEETSQAAPQ
jgi:hypothetical protein